MKQNKERGLSKVDIVLIVLIIIACITIFFLLKSDQPKGIALEENVVINYVPEGANKQNTTNTEVSSNIALSNEIIYQGGNTNPQQSSQQVQNLDAYKYYFYNQLDDRAKSLYGIILNNIDCFKDGYKKIEISAGSENADVNFQACWDAFSMDKPEIFYVDTKKVSLVSHSTSNIISTQYSLTIQPQGDGSYFLGAWTSSDQVQNAINEVEMEANKIVNEANQQANLYDKVKYVHDYIIDKAEYDRTEDINNSDIYGLLVKHRAVCEGYAKAFKYLLDKLGIPCVMICGNGYSDDGSSEFHAWNYVLMDDGKWYAVDTTWDDPIVVGNGTVSEKTKHRYFLVGSNNFSATHVEDGDVSGTGQRFQYPQINSEDY